MNNVICPVSNEKVPAHLPRVTAFYAISLIVAYIITLSLPILALLLIDFMTRAINRPNLSIIHFLAKNTSKVLKLKSVKIDKAPKVFAARLGTLMLAAAMIFHGGGLLLSSSIVAVLVALLATFECAFNFCAGCYIYSAFVFPFYSKK